MHAALALVCVCVFDVSTLADDTPADPITALEAALMYPGTRLPMSAQRDPPPDAEVWQIEHDAGHTEAWFLPGRGVSEKRPGPLLVVAHGNNELIDRVPPRLRWWRRSGFSALVVEYRGYGRSTGFPGQDAIVTDFVEAVRRAKQLAEVDAERVVVVGYSLGTGVACQVAAREPLAAVLLVSPFTSAVDLATEHGLPGELMRDRWDSLAALQGIDTPVWIAHGRRDRVIPVEHGRRIAEALGERATLHEFAGGHEDLPGWLTLWPSLRPVLVEAGVVADSTQRRERPSPHATMPAR